MNPPPPPPPPMSQGHLEGGHYPGASGVQKIQDSSFIVALNVIGTISHVLLGTVALGAFLLANWITQVVPDSRFSAHVYLTVLGYGILLSTTLLTLKPHRGWGNNLLYPEKNTLYWILQIIGSGLAFIGCIMGVVRVNNIALAVHLDSSHAIVGFITLLLTAASLVGGIANAVHQGIANTPIFKAIYTCTGVLTLTLAFIALALVFNIFEPLIFAANANLLISLCVLIIVGMLTMLLANVAVRGILI